MRAARANPPIQSGPVAGNPPVGGGVDVGVGFPAATDVPGDGVEEGVTTGGVEVAAVGSSVGHWPVARQLPGGIGTVSELGVDGGAEDAEGDPASGAAGGAGTVVVVDVDGAGGTVVGEGGSDDVDGGTVPSVVVVGCGPQ